MGSWIPSFVISTDINATGLTYRREATRSAQPQRFSRMCLHWNWADFPTVGQTNSTDGKQQTQFCIRP